MADFQKSANDALVDEPIDIELRGSTPDTLLVVRAQFQDDLGQTWVSKAQFRSDAKGNIKLRTAQPISDSYQLPDPMGLLWSMQVQTDEAEDKIWRPATNSLKPLSVTLTAEDDGEFVADTTLTRRFLKAGINVTDVREEDSVATLFRPTHGTPKTTVLVFGGSGGGFSWSHQVAWILASRGCAAMAVAYLDWNEEFGLPKLFAELPLENFAKAYDYLAAQAELNLNDLTVIGFSKGAELALVLATIYPEIQRVIGYVPSSLVWCGFTFQHVVSRSSWSYKGQPLPFALFSYGHFDENGWQDQEMLGAATIPVEKMTAPLLLISVTDDIVWPSTRMANDIMLRLEAGSCTQRRKHLSLEGAGHSLGVPNLPTVVYGGVEQAANAQAERQAWKEALKFLGLPSRAA